MDFVHLRAERHCAFFGYFITGFNADAVEFRMSEEADVYTDSHAGDQHIAAAGTEKRRFRLMQSDSMHKRADQIFAQFMFFEICSGRRIDFAAGLADNKLLFRQTERFAQIFDAFLLPWVYFPLTGSASPMTPA